MDQPTLDGINTYFISKAAKDEGLKVVLSGLGADELLGGYPSFKRINSVETAKKLPAFVFNMAYPFLSYDYQKLSFLTIADDLGTYLFLRGLFSVKTTAKLLNIEEGYVNEVLQKVYFKDMLDGIHGGNKASWLETNMYMKNQLLKDSDIMSMWHSLELRVPFLDQEFIKAVFSIDPDIKFMGKPKELLIEAFKDILPGEIWDRPKQGFTFPFKEWMQKSPYVNKLDNLNNKEFSKIKDKFENDKIHWSRLWSLVIVNEWRTNKG
jgi:asparagine synthase (glutamine-hydrolysing)